MEKSRWERRWHLASGHRRLVARPGLRPLKRRQEMHQMPFGIVCRCAPVAVTTSHIPSPRRQLPGSGIEELIRRSSELSKGLPPSLRPRAPAGGDKPDNDVRAELIGLGGDAHEGQEFVQGIRADRTDYCRCQSCKPWQGLLAQTTQKIAFTILDGRVRGHPGHA